MPKIQSNPPPVEKSEEHDPWIMVSCRKFSFEVDPTHLGRPKNGRKPILTSEIGATFLCCGSSVGALVSHPLGEKLHGYSRDNLRTVEINCNDPAVVNGTLFRGPDNGRKHREFEAAILNCFKAKGWTEDQSARPEYNYDDVEGSRFVQAPGESGPHIVIIKVSELFNGNSKDARHARGLIERLASCAKSQAHLGALHDYAVKNLPEGRAIAEKCRTRLRMWSGR